MRIKLGGAFALLAAVFALSAVMSASALATTPEWQFKGKAITTPIKVNGNWPKATPLTLTDAKLNVVLTCRAKSENSVSSKTVETTSTEWTSCEISKGGDCESEREVTDVAVGLPWTAELYEEGGKLRERIKGSKGKAVGWAFGCTVFGSEVGNECTATELTAALSNVSGGVDVAFDSLTPKLKCTGYDGYPSEVGSVEGTELLEDTGLTVI